MKTSGELFKVCMEKIVIFQHVFKIEKMSSKIFQKIGIFLGSGGFPAAPILGEAMNVKPGMHGS